jgi:hypothetical protein
MDCVKPDKRAFVADLRAELEFLLINDDTAPDWSGHELAMILRRFDRAALNVVHHRTHQQPDRIRRSSTADQAVDLPA